MNERLQLPLRPAGASLSAYVAGLDLLAARLDLLPCRSHWPARIPINSKASFDGDIVHTNQLKVNIGGEWWVEMTASEAADYVRRRKAYLLDEQARLLEGNPRELDITVPPDSDIEMSSTGMSHPTAHPVKFDPLFAHPIRAGSPPGSTSDADTASSVTGHNGASKGKMAGRASDAPGPANATSAPSTASPVKTVTKARAGDAPVGTSSNPALPKDLQALVDLMGEQMQDKLSIPKQNGGDETVNEDGLPIHEIRETLDGNTIGAAPEPSSEALEAADEKESDYWSPEAVARRAALRRRIFHEDSSDEDDDMDRDAMDVDTEDLPSASAETPSTFPSAAGKPGENPTQLASPEKQASPSTSDKTSQPSSPERALQANSTVAPGTRSPSNPPKSILKVPHRKKSVTFDPSTRLPPDSPPARSPTGKLGFPLGDIVTESSGGPKPVPILAPPTPGRKTAAATFGGLNRGFLSSPGSMTSPVPSANEGPKIEEIDGDVDMESQPAKKQSVFAQRRAERTPALPSLANAKPMAAMKTDIVEKAPASGTPGPAAAPAMLPTPTAPKTPVMPSVVGNLPPTVGTVAGTGSQPPVLVVDHDDDDSDYGDLGDFSDDEEDEYALDEALLAREVALEYHRRQGWQRPIDEDEIDPEAEGEGSGDVLMGVPRVSSVTGGGGDDDPLRIVNPTADDLSQFLRVGRADDGELVFERPIVDSGSESDGEGETEAQKADRRERRARRKNVMDRLLRGEYEDPTVVDSPEVQRQAWERSLPPNVGAAATPAPAAPAVEPTPAPAPTSRRIETGPVVERSSAPAQTVSPPAEAPKRVSRFKAARQAQN